MWLKTRLSHLFLFIFSLTCLLAAFYIQYQLKQDPCPLCMMQRISIGLIILTSLAALLFSQFRNHMIYWMLQSLWVIAGLYFVSRQLWLQSLPPEKVPACMPALNILMTYFPLSTLMKALFWGGGSCAVVKYHLFGLSLAAWSAIYFGLAALILIVGWRSARHAG